MKPIAGEGKSSEYLPRAVQTSNLKKAFKCGWTEYSLELPHARTQDTASILDYSEL